MGLSSAAITEITQLQRQIAIETAVRGATRMAFEEMAEEARHRANIRSGAVKNAFMCFANSLSKQAARALAKEKPDAC